MPRPARSRAGAHQDGGSARAPRASHRRRAGRPAPLDEQRDSVTLVHRRQVELGLTGDPQRLTARRHESKRRAAASSSTSGRAASGRGAAPGCRGRHGLASHRSASRSRRHCHRRRPSLGDQGHDQCCVANGCERYEDRATVRVFGQEPGKLDRKARLARAAGTDDRQQARVTVKPDGSRLEELTLAPEEARRRSGKVDGAGVLSGGNSAPPSWNSRAGASKSLSRCGPRSRSGSSSSSAAVEAETIT